MNNFWWVVWRISGGIFVVVCGIILAWIYWRVPAERAGTITHLSFTRDSSRLVACQGHLGPYRWENCEIAVYDCKFWQFNSRFGKDILRKTPWAVGHLRKQSHCITITEHVLVKSRFPFGLLVTPAYALPSSDGPHVFMEWALYGGLDQLVRLAKLYGRPALGRTDIITDLAVDSEDDIVAVGTAHETLAAAYGLHRLVSGKKTLALHLATLKVAWELDKGYAQVKADAEGRLCLCCRTSFPPLPQHAALAFQYDKEEYEAAGGPEVILLDIKSGKVLAKLDVQKINPRLVTWWGGTGKILVLNDSGKLFALTQDLAKMQHLVDTGISGTHPIELNTDSEGKFVVIADRRQVEVYSATTWKLEHKWQCQEKEYVTAASCSPNGRYIAWAVAKKVPSSRGPISVCRLRIFDLSTNTMRLDTQANQMPVSGQ